MFQADDRIGLAITQPLKVTECNGTCTTTDVENSKDDDIFGAVLTTVFKF